MISLAHIINPVKVDKSSDLYLAQPITFETMRTAKKYAGADADVTLYATHYPEDSDFPLKDFNCLPALNRSVLDIGEFNIKRKLPLLRDILGPICEASQVQFIIYTNVDIALQPHFYLAVEGFIQQGYDAFVINRRTITDQYTSIPEIPFMYAQMGDSHKGYDCFVFKRELYSQFELGNIFIGTAWIGRALLANMVAYADKFREFRDKHLTFHIGDPCSWRNEAFSDYFEANLKEYQSLFTKLESQNGPFDPMLRSYLVDTGDKRVIPDFEHCCIKKGKII